MSTTTITIPGPVANQLRQGLTLKMGEAAQALEQASLGERRGRSAETFRQHFEAIDAYREAMVALGYEDERDPRDAEIDLDEHRETLEAGLAEARSILRGFAEEGSAQERQQAAIELGEVERFAALLAAMGGLLPMVALSLLIEAGEQGLDTEQLADKAKRDSDPGRAEVVAVLERFAGRGLVVREGERWRSTPAALEARVFPF